MHFKSICFFSLLFLYFLWFFWEFIFWISKTTTILPRIFVPKGINGVSDTALNRSSPVIFKILGTSVSYPL